MFDNLIRHLIHGMYAPAPRVYREPIPAPVVVPVVEVVEALTVEQVALQMLQGGYSIRATQRETGLTFHKVRKMYHAMR